MCLQTMVGAAPTWVTATAIVGAVIMVYGLMVIYSIAAEASPSRIMVVCSRSNVSSVTNSIA